MTGSETATSPQSEGRSTSLILTINGGSSSIKFAAFAVEGDSSAGHTPFQSSTGTVQQEMRSVTPRRVLWGMVDRIGLPGTRLTASGADGKAADTRPIAASDHRSSAKELIDYLHERLGRQSITGIGHRVVHGGMHLLTHQVVTPDLIAELKRTQPLDLAHLPREIALIEVFRDTFPELPQVACFDTAFHRDLPSVAQIMPIPRRYSEKGIRRFGFHGLSYAYLMGELARVAGDEAANGKVILAHLGSGASMAAVRGGKPIDTTMAFTPTAGLVMGTRPGDIDPGLLVYLMRVEKMGPDEMDDFISRQCGLIGISETSSDMRDLLANRAGDPRAADAVDAFCYQARKWIGALSAALEGLDTLVFSAGIGEHSSEARASICDGLDYLGLSLDPVLNQAGAAVISAVQSRVTVRVIATDEESVIARAVWGLLGAKSE